MGRYNAQGLTTTTAGQKDGEVEESVRSLPLPLPCGDDDESPLNDSEQYAAACQLSPDKVEILLRSTPIDLSGDGGEFVKVVLRGGRVQGALLVGDTQLEEVMENLILNRINIHHIGVDLLNPDLDIGDYFD